MTTTEKRSNWTPAQRRRVAAAAARASRALRSATVRPLGSRRLSSASR